MTAESANLKYILLIAVIAAAVLVVGNWLKPKDKPSEPAISQTEMARLQKLTQRRLLEDMASYVSEIAAGTASHLVHLKTVGGSALVWTGGGMFLTGDSEGRFPDSVVVVTPTGMQAEATTIRASPDLPVVSLQAPLLPGQRPVSPRSPEMVQPGEWVLAVWLQADGRHGFAPGTHSGVVSSTCGEFTYRQLLSNLPLEAAMRGGGVFDLAGNLIAAILRCGESYVAMAPEDVESAWRLAILFDRQLLRRFGMRVEPLDELGRAYFNTDAGLLVTEVWKGYPADAMGLIPGDVVMALNGKTVEKPEDLAMLLQPPGDAILALRLRRGRSELSVSLPAEDPPSFRAMRNSLHSGIALQNEAPGFVIESLEPQSRAAQAGIRAGDRLLQVGRRAITTPQAIQRTLSSQNDEPIFVVVERDKKKWGVFLR